MKKITKKGEITLNFIVMAILALLVLLVIAFIFREQITNVAKQFTGLGDNAGNKATSCLDNPSNPDCDPFANNKPIQENNKNKPD